MSERKNASPFWSSVPTFNVPCWTGLLITLLTGGSFVSTTATQESSQASPQVSQASFHLSQVSSGLVHVSTANISATGQMPVYSSVFPTPVACPTWLLYSLLSSGTFGSQATQASTQASQISSSVLQASSAKYDATGQMLVCSSVFPTATGLFLTQQLQFNAQWSHLHTYSWFFHNHTCSHPLIQVTYPLCYLFYLRPYLLLSHIICVIISASVQ